MNLPIEFWIITGFLLIIIEFTMPAIGFLFLGFGALASSILFFSYPELNDYQIAVFGACSLAWFVILWYPMKQFIYSGSPKSNDYFNIIGARVKVISPEIAPGQRGQVKWSGTIMNAMLRADEIISAKDGDNLYVLEVKGSLLICSFNQGR